MKVVEPDGLAIATIWAEAEGEPYFAKVGVGIVLRNRMNRHYASDGTVAGTVARRYQFSAYNDDKADNARLIKSLGIDDTDPVVMDCVKAWHEAEDSDLLPNEAVCYYATTIPQPPWASRMEFIAQFGKTRFYKERA